MYYKRLAMSIKTFSQLCDLHILLAQLQRIKFYMYFMANYELRSEWQLCEIVNKVFIFRIVSKFNDQVLTLHEYVFIQEKRALG